MSRAGKDLLERYLNSRARRGGRWAIPNPLTVQEFVSGLKETRNYAEELLEFVKAEVTPQNAENLLQLLEVKNTEVMKKAFSSMPFLKAEKNIDKSLATLVDCGMTFEKLCMLSYQKTYPTDKTELRTLLSLPKEWAENLYN